MSSSDRVPVLFLSAPRGWTVYVRYEGDDVYLVHGSRGGSGRRTSMRFLSRDAAAEYLQSLLPSRDVEMALYSVLERGVHHESFDAYNDAANASSSLELLGEDDADTGFDALRGCLLLLRDGRCLT